MDYCGKVYACGNLLYFMFMLTSYISLVIKNLLLKQGNRENKQCIFPLSLCHTGNLAGVF